jgi:hypothetical protein
LAKKKETEEKLQPKEFRDKSSNWWLAGKHYHLNKENEIIICAGGSSDDTEIELLRAYIIRNKKTYKDREISPCISQKEYLEIVNGGKYSGMSVQDIFNSDKSYLTWAIKNFNFEGKEKLKEEITEILKK